jgi:hypothetical protein
MTTICAWCEHEGRRVVLSEGSAPDDLTVTYGICQHHAARLVSQLHRHFPPRPGSTEVSAA